MSTLPEVFSLAVQHHQAGRLEQAESLYRQILQVEPQHPDALHLLGVIAFQGGQHAVAIQYITQAIAQDSRRAEFHYNLGNILKAEGKLAEAIAHYERALGLRPAFAEAQNNLANALKGEGKLAEAVGHYQQAIALRPDFAEAHNNLGVALQEQGYLAEAVTHYRQALALRPAYAEGYYNLASAHAQGRRLEEAIAHYRMALALKPAYPEAHNNLGLALAEQKKLGEAVAHFRQALALQPGYADVHYNLANVLIDQGKLGDATGHFRQALALKPVYPEAENQLLHQLQHLCEWVGLEGMVAHQRQFVWTDPLARIAPFAFLSLPTSPAEQLRCARNYVASWLPPMARLREQCRFAFVRTAKPRLRLGYLSADFRQRLIDAVFESHDRSRFEVFAYCYGPDDVSAIRRRLVSAFDRFTDISAASFEEAARLINADGIDILIDLQGYTKFARPQILALRPSPVQVNYWGYPGTMGADFMDYIITDRFTTPPAHEPYFAEKIVHLPDCYVPPGHQREISEAAPPRRDLGLPDDVFVFCCFNNSYKLTPTLFDLWMRLLKAIPGSVLWLLAANSTANANLRMEAQVRGVGAERLVFAPRLPMPQHLARHRQADLFLDTVPVNAHTTCSEALWAGLPVLTCVGETFVSRVAGSLLTAIGLPELITYTLEDYESLALRLAQHPAELATLRGRLWQNRLTAPLFDTPRFTRHLETAYQMMWERYLKGEPPSQIDVPPLPAEP
jgi:predicted O-linked N-acetylglucosamine transferase (SPINDLY family)